MKYRIVVEADDMRGIVAASIKAASDIARSPMPFARLEIPASSGLHEKVHVEMIHEADEETENE